MAMDFQQLLQFAVERNASDVHLQTGVPAMLRLAGEMHATDQPALTDQEMREFLILISPERFHDDLDGKLTAGMDFSYSTPGGARFRCSAYRELGRVGMVMRVIKSKVPAIAELNLPTVMSDIALSGRGLTLVTGTTGSGKSTTLAAMIDLINQNHAAKIITIEDPVEYLHTPAKALISQIEVGSDTVSFEQALRQALRQDPDVILVGELRDVETLRIALRAADTGHQVFSTVHSSNAPQTIERIIAMFPPAEHKILLTQLAGSIEAIISQRLVKTRDGGRRPAIEILRGSPVTAKHILDGKALELTEYMRTALAGMQTFDQHLLSMYREQLISGTESLRNASSPEALSMAMRGIHQARGVDASAKPALHPSAQVKMPAPLKTVEEIPMQREN